MKRLLLALVACLPVALFAQAAAAKATTGIPGSLPPNATQAPTVSAGSVAGVNTVLPEDAPSILGLSPADLLTRFGPPLRVYAVRGEEAWQDDVVFDYGYFALYLYANALWQIQISPMYPGSVLGLPSAPGLDALEAALGIGLALEGGALEWVLKPRPWPVRLRAVAGTPGSAPELYLYRADF